MSKKIFSILSVLMVAALVLTACAPAATEAPAPTQPPASAQTEAAPETKAVVESPTQTQAPAPTQAVAAPQTAAATEAPALAPGSITINGAGATFPLPVYTEWNYAYQYVDPSVVMNYQGIGSGGGKKGIIDNTIDYAGSDSLLKDEEYAAGGDLQMFPILAGAVVPIYNIEGITKTVTLNGDILAGIYMGTIKKWNEPVIKELNPEIAGQLPDAAITAVHRSDGSGTTEIFTKFLAAANADWKNGPGAGSAIEWQVDKTGNGIGGKGNQGVAVAVLNTPNSIGYVELSYAVANKIAYSQMVNAAGTTVTADAASLESAMNDFANAFSDKLTSDIVNGEGEASWPIAGYTYLIVHMNSMTDCVKAQKLVNYIVWALTDPSAAKRAGELGYSVLPAAIREKVLVRLSEMTCNGKPVLTK